MNYKNIAFLLLFCGINSNQASIPNFKNIPSLKKPTYILAGIGCYALSLWSLSKSLSSTGLCYLSCKRTSHDYAETLQREGRDLLTEREITFWSTVEGISTAPTVFWKDISYFTLSILSAYVGTKILKNSEDKKPLFLLMEREEEKSGTRNS